MPDQPPAPPPPDEQPAEAAGVRITLEGTTWEFSEDTAENTELIALEDATGLTTGECLDALNRGSMKVLTALVWVLRRRIEPALGLADVRFKARDLRVEFVQPDAEGKAP